MKFIIIHSTTVLTLGLYNINLHAKIFNWVHTHFKQDAATNFASDVGAMFNQIFFLATNLKYSVNIGLVKYVIIFEKYNLN